MLTLRYEWPKAGTTMQRSLEAVDLILRFLEVCGDLVPIDLHDIDGIVVVTSLPQFHEITARLGMLGSLVQAVVVVEVKCYLTRVPAIILGSFPDSYLRRMIKIQAAHSGRSVR